MKLGVLFPQMEFGADPIAIKEYAQTAEQLGYESLAVYDHVVSANPEGRTEPWVASYHRHMFHEPFVLFGLPGRGHTTTGVRPQYGSLEKAMPRWIGLRALRMVGSREAV